jgi:quercetin dioxygenase-like cupin family protein
MCVRKTGKRIYVPAGEEHRFVDVTEDLAVLVTFAPPERVGEATSVPGLPAEPKIDMVLVLADSAD